MLALSEPEDEMEPLSAETERNVAANHAAWQFALRCRDIEEHTPATEETSLFRSLNTLVTELWDNGFSTAEILAALAFAHSDIVRYAGPEERNGTGIRGVALERNN